jgi:hypothetical protein
MPDADYRTVSEFVNGSLELGTVDIYEDELLTRQIVAGHAYKQVSDEINIANGGSTVWYTPATLLAPVLLEDEVSFFRGTRGRAVAYGAGDDIELRNYAPDRRPVETAAKLQLFNAAVNFGFIDIYVVESGESIEDALFPTSRLFPTGTVADTITLVAGEYDIYITEFDQEEILEGPIPIDVEIGDVLGGIVFDTVDPAILELILLPDNP